MSDELREQLADIQHAIWAHWMGYMFGCGEFRKDDTWVMPAEKLERWWRQKEAPYSELSDKERESDRHQADKILAVVQPALAAANARAEAAEAVAGNMLNHLLPDTIRAIVLDLSAAERHAPDMGEFAITPQTLEFRDKCAAFLGAEWPDSAWDEEWLTALDAERARRARSEQDEVQSRAT